MANVVHVCPRYLPAHGGAELFFAKVSEALASRGHSVSVWTTDALTVQAFTSSAGERLPAGRTDINGVEVQRFPIRYLPAQRYVRTAAHWLPFGTRWKCDTLRWTPWIPALTRAASKPSVRVDLVHASGLPYSSVLFAGARLAERTGAPLIMTPFTHVAPPGPVGARMRRAYLSPLNSRLLARADRVFVQTTLERDTLAGIHVPADHQTVAGLGIDATDCTGGNRKRARRSWHVPDDTPVVGHLANKSWDKGTVDLLDAAEQLWDKGVEFTLVLAGSEMPSFVERWSRARYPQRTVNLGPLSADERRDFFAAINVFALPSYVESFGVSPLEAGLNGAAVAAYDHGGPGQIFRDGDTAMLAPVGNVGVFAEKLERLIVDVQDRRRLGEAARLLAREYSWSRVLEVIMADYDRLLER